MSAYGATNTPANTIFLPSTTWHLKSKRPDTPSSLTIHHLTLATAEALPGLVDYIHKTFADELERGQTYPQEILAGEEYTRALFDAYYFAKDVLVAVLGKEGDAPQQDGAAFQAGFADAVGGRSWEKSIAGCYYVSTFFRFLLVAILPFRACASPRRQARARALRMWSPIVDRRNPY